ncbi:MAG: ABC transporter permease [Pseudomonadota bacterium]
MATSTENIPMPPQSAVAGGPVGGIISFLVICIGGIVAFLIGAAATYAGSMVIGAVAAVGLPSWISFLLYCALVIASCGLAAFVFRLLLQKFTVETVAKPMRQAPLTAAFGLMVILLYVIAAIFADVLAPYGEAQVFDRINLPPGGNPDLGGDPAHILGTDQIGRDLLTRLIYGARNTVGIAFVTTLLAFLLGSTIGFLAATLGGWVDQLTSRIVDVLMAIPSLIFALLIITIVGQSTINMILVIAVLDSTRVFRLARAVGVNIVVMDYIEAAKLRGENLGYLIFKEILPNATAPLLAEFGLRFCFVFLTIAALSFLGIGIQPPLADWGSMVSELRQFISFAQWDILSASLPLMAAGAIALLTVAVNFVVDWMLHRSSGLKE